MVKRICVLFADGSINVIAPHKGEGAALSEARHDRDVWNKGERDRAKLAQVGEIDVDLMSFKERI